MFNDYNWTCCRLCEAVVHKALQEHLDSLHVAFSLNLCLNLYWRLTAEPDSHQSVRHTFCSLHLFRSNMSVCPLHSRETHLALFPDVCLSDHHLQLPVSIFYCCRVQQRHTRPGVKDRPAGEQERCNTTTFVYSCTLCTTASEYEWTILRLLWLGGEQLVPGPHCPLICAPWSVKRDLNGVKTEGKSHDSVWEFLAKQLCRHCQ